VAVEYGILLGFIVFVIIVGVAALGDNLGAYFVRLATDLAGYLGV
jgi:Flp pilus assembly pilin Flp